MHANSLVWKAGERGGGAKKNEEPKEAGAHGDLTPKWWDSFQKDRIREAPWDTQSTHAQQESDLGCCQLKSVREVHQDEPLTLAGSSCIQGAQNVWKVIHLKMTTMYIKGGVGQWKRPRPWSQAGWESLSQLACHWFRPLPYLGFTCLTVSP